VTIENYPTGLTGASEGYSKDKNASGYPEEIDQANLQTINNEKNAFDFEASKMFVDQAQKSWASDDGFQDSSESDYSISSGLQRMREAILIHLLRKMKSQIKANKSEHIMEAAIKIEEQERKMTMFRHIPNSEPTPHPASPDAHCRRQGLLVQKQFSEKGEEEKTQVKRSDFKDLTTLRGTRTFFNDKLMLVKQKKPCLTIIKKEEVVQPRMLAAAA